MRERTQGRKGGGCGGRGGITELGRGEGGLFCPSSAAPPQTLTPMLSALNLRKEPPSFLRTGRYTPASFFCPRLLPLFHLDILFFRLLLHRISAENGEKGRHKTILITPPRIKKKRGNKGEHLVRGQLGKTTRISSYPFCGPPK